MVDYILFNYAFDVYSFLAGAGIMLLISVAWLLTKKYRKKQKGFVNLREEIKKGHDAIVAANDGIIIASESFHNLMGVMDDIDKNG